jgi:hypothetical protein
MDRTAYVKRCKSDAQMLDISCKTKSLRHFSDEENTCQRAPSFLSIADNDSPETRMPNGPLAEAQTAACARNRLSVKRLATRREAAPRAQKIAASAEEGAESNRRATH